MGQTVFWPKMDPIITDFDGNRGDRFPPARPRILSGSREPGGPGRANNLIFVFFGGGCRGAHACYSLRGRTSPFLPESLQGGCAKTATESPEPSGIGLMGNPVRSHSCVTLLTCLVACDRARGQGPGPSGRGPGPGVRAPRFLGEFLEPSCPRSRI